MIIEVVEVSFPGRVHVVEVGQFPLPPSVKLSGAEIVQAIDAELGGQGWQTSSTESGQDGADAYAVALANGFTGTVEEWLDSLVGPQGEQGVQGAQGEPGGQGDPGVAGEDGEGGASAYELAVAAGYIGTESEWLASLKGDKGETGAAGTNGQDGESAYELAVAGGYSGTEAEWLASLQGTAGADGSMITVSATEPSNPVEGDLWLDIS
jgi:hypothetical protein